MVLGFGLFAARDALGLAAFRSRGLRAAYLAMGLGAGSVLGLAAESLSRQDALALVGEPWFLASAVSIHCILWLLFERARRSRRPRQSVGWLFLLPPPVLLFATGVAVWNVLLVANAPGSLAGAAIMAVYGAVALTAAAAARRLASREGALAFAATTNLSALLLVILPQEAVPGRASALPIDWAHSLPVLGIIASMVGISFLIARLRHPV